MITQILDVRNTIDNLYTVVRDSAVERAGKDADHSFASSYATGYLIAELAFVISSMPKKHVDAALKELQKSVERNRPVTLVDTLAEGIESGYYKDSANGL